MTHDYETNHDHAPSFRADQQAA